VGRLLANVCIACLYGRLIKQHCSRARSQVQALSCVRSKQAGVPAQVKKAQTLTEKILARAQQRERGARPEHLDQRR
jgi:hypothetical protein